MIKTLFALTSILILQALCLAQPNSHLVKTKPLVIGDQITYYSAVLSEERILNIYLPHGYSKDSSQHYPVIYLLDGSMHEDFIHIAGLVQFGSYSWINFIPKSIVVGISNVNRYRDFTFPSKVKRDKKTNPDGGGSASFIKFLESELQPMIEKTYNTTNEKTIIGQSLGGLLATEILMTKPQLFTNYIIISPSLWWNKQSLLKIDLPDLQSVKSIYVGVGKEGKTMEKDAAALYQKIQKTTSVSLNTQFKFFEKQDHGDVLHLAVYDAFNALFNKLEAK